MIGKRLLAGVTCAVLTCLNPWTNLAHAAENVIKVGFNLPLTGMFALVGDHARSAAELVRTELEAEGGLQIDGKRYKLEFIYANNASDPAAASRVAVELVSRDKVLGIIGPLSSRQAIPVSLVANSFSVPMISPWSTSPETTRDKPYVFRSCFVYTLQGPVLTKFAAQQWGVTKAAVLFDVMSSYPNGMAKAFRAGFEAVNGPGSVVAFEEFRTNSLDFHEQIENIKKSGAELLFLPQHYNEVPVIVRQARDLGLTIPIVGSNSWSGGDLIGSCKGDCNGLFYTGNYAPGRAKGINKVFVDAYSSAYNEQPDEVAALTWDGVRAFLEAVKKAGAPSGHLLNDRKAVRDALVNVKKFDGATGMMSFNESGNPDKCVVIVNIENDSLNYHDVVCP